MVILMNYTPTVLTNIKEQFMQKSLYAVEISVHPLIAFQIGIVFWVVLLIVER